MEEKIQVCVVLETYIRYKNVKKVGDRVFGEWQYVSNAEDNNKGCRIMFGWDQNLIEAWLIHKSKQSMLLLFESLCRKTRFFCTVVYASN